MSARRKVPWLLAIPGLGFLLLFHFVAGASGAYYAFTDWDGLSNSANWVGLENFRQIFREPATRGALLHTIQLAATFVVAVNVIGLALAIGLNRAIKSRNILRSLFFAPVVMSELAVSYVWQYIFDFNGPLNALLGTLGLESWQRAWLGDPTWALWCVLVVMIWQFSGLTMMIYLAGLQGVPDELEEAAAVDGATTWYRFRRIVLPLLAPAITIASTLTLIYGLRVFDQVMALTGGGPVDATETLATQVYKQAFLYGRFAYSAAMALILAAMVAALSIGQMLILRRREAAI